MTRGRDSGSGDTVDDPEELVREDEELRELFITLAESDAQCGARFRRALDRIGIEYDYDGGDGE